MNVVCMRCNTRYEFDDALVSSRGTSVKCTNCGHKFRVHPPAGKAGQPDQWIIRKSSGVTQRFGSLRELQKALHEGTVTIADEISRDGNAYRPIHAVPELESFFPKTAIGAPIPGTLMGVSAPHRPTPIPRPGREAPPSRADYDDEEEATAVYSNEQLNKLRPMRSTPPVAERSPSTSRIPTSERRAGGPTLSRSPVVKSPIQGVAPSGEGQAAVARTNQPVGVPAAAPAASSLPPIISRPPGGGLGAQRPISIPITAPAGSAPLPGTPTISVTSGPKPPPAFGNPPPAIVNAPPMLGSPPPAPGNAPPALVNPAPALGSAPPALVNPAPALGNAPPALVNPPPGITARAPAPEPPRAAPPVAPMAKQTVVGLAPPPGTQASRAPSAVRVGTSRPPEVMARGNPAGPAFATPSSDSGARPLSGTLSGSPPAASAVPAAGTLGSPPAPAVAPATATGISPSAPAVVAAPIPAMAATALAPRQVDAKAVSTAATIQAPHGRLEVPQPTRGLVPPTPSHPGAIPMQALPVSSVGPSLQQPADFIRGDARDADAAGLRRRTRRNGDTGDPGAPLDNLQRAATASAFDALDLEPPSSVARPRSNVRWVFALLLLGGVVGVALVVGRSYLNKPRSVDAYDAQVDALLDSGHALLGRGDVGGARRQFEQARELARDNPKVISAELVLQGTVCDQSWLGLRLFPEDAPETAAARSALGDCSREIGTMTARARQVAEVPPELDAALIDAFRLQDDLAQARTHAVKLSEHASLPAAAYALALLDVADAAPSWATVIDRLRLATGAERMPGRAHMALAYALVQSGDLEAARIEIGKLKSASRPHPLVDRLEEYVEAKTSGAAAGSSAVALVEPPLGVSPVPAGEGAPQTGSGPGVDPMEGARAARAKGDLAAAERFYQQALQLDPGNVGALTGLGDVERGRGNKAAALSHYHAAMRANGQHPPAIAGAADVLWSSGDRAEAVKYYRRIGAGNAYSAKAQQRIAEFEGNKAPVPVPDSDPGPAEDRPGEAAPEPPKEPIEPPDESEDEASEPEPVPIPRESPPSIPGPAPKDDP